MARDVCEKAEKWWANIDADSEGAVNVNVNEDSDLTVSILPSTAGYSLHSPRCRRCHC